MTDPADYNRFAEWFDVLAVTHRLQASDEMRGKMKGEYFDVLASYPLDAVEFAYQNLRRKMKKWPVPADWLEALPPFGNVNRLENISAADLAETQEAEALGYERAEACDCPTCHRELVAPMKPRYVPRLDRDGNVIERRHPGRVGRPIVLGRWIHGNELKRWYFAYGAFMAMKAKVWQTLQLERRSLKPQERAEDLARKANLKIISNARPPTPDENRPTI